MISHYTRRQIRERIRRFFGGLPCRVQVAALPWRLTAEGVEVLLVTSRGSGRWVLPKGWPEGAERMSEAAAREAAEEAGIAGATSSSEIGRYYYAKTLRSGMEWRCEVHVFPLEVDTIAEKWPEMKKRQRRWFRARDAAKLVSERDLGDLIAHFGRDPRKLAA